MTKSGRIVFNNRELPYYIDHSDGVIWFVANDIAEMLEYAGNRADQMVDLVEPDEKCKQKINFGGGQKRTLWLISELGLYNILSQSRKPTARLWRRVVHQQLIDIRKAKGMTIDDQFDEWDDLLDRLYFDEKTKMWMESITVEGGDVEQVPYEE